MSDVNSQTIPDGTSSVSALGLRWAALRGMLGSPLIEAEEQRTLREDLIRELQTLERDFALLASRNTAEISAKLDVALTVMRPTFPEEQQWMIDLLESVQADLRSVQGAFAAPRPERASGSQRRYTTATAPAAPEPTEPEAAAAE
jgi:hypothetical protein